MFVFLTSSPPGRGFRHLKVGHVRQLRVGPAGGERAERERRRPALLPGGGEHLPELQDQPESGAAPLRRLPPRRVSGSAAQQARWFHIRIIIFMEHFSLLRAITKCETYITYNNIYYILCWVVSILSAWIWSLWRHRHDVDRLLLSTAWWRLLCDRRKEERKLWIIQKNQNVSNQTKLSEKADAKKTMKSNKTCCCRCATYWKSLIMIFNTNSQLIFS